MEVQKENKILFWEFQKEASLSNKQCAEYLDVTKRSIERWRIGKPEAPKMAILSLQYCVLNAKLDNEGNSDVFDSI